CLERLLAERFEGPIGPLRYLFGALVFDHPERRVLVDRLGEARIGGNRGDVHITMHVRGEQLRRQTHVPRYVTGIVDHGVPATARECIEWSVAVATQLLHLRE